MFAQLLASRPVRQRSTTGLGASVALHGLFIAGAVSATVSTTTTEPPPVAQHVIYVPPQPERPRVATPPSAAMRPPAAVPGMISVPISVPELLPIADPVRSLGTMLPTTLFVPGGLIAPEAPTVPAGSPYLVEQVEVPVTIERGSPMPRFPATMRFSGVEGTARFQFVVDTLGRVELSSVRELQSTNESFAWAVRGTLPRMRFTPARVGGHPVRQLVEFPIIFRIER